MTPKGNDSELESESRGIGGGVGGPRHWVTADQSADQAARLTEASRKAANVELDSGEQAPIQRESKAILQIQAMDFKAPIRKIGSSSTFEDLKIFLILTVLTIAMALAVRWLF